MSNRWCATCAYRSRENTEHPCLSCEYEKPTQYKRDKEEEPFFDLDAALRSEYFKVRYHGEEKDFYCGRILEDTALAYNGFAVGRVTTKIDLDLIER